MCTISAFIAKKYWLSKADHECISDGAWLGGNHTPGFLGYLKITLILPTHHGISVREIKILRRILLVPCLELSLHPSVHDQMFNTECCNLVFTHRDQLICSITSRSKNSFCSRNKTEFRDNSLFRLHFCEEPHKPHKNSYLHMQVTGR